MTKEQAPMCRQQSFATHGTQGHVCHHTGVHTTEPLQRERLNSTTLGRTFWEPLIWTSRLSWKKLAKTSLPSQTPATITDNCHPVEKCITDHAQNNITKFLVTVMHAGLIHIYWRIVVWQLRQAMGSQRVHYFSTVFVHVHNKEHPPEYNIMLTVTWVAMATSLIACTTLQDVVEPPTVATDKSTLPNQVNRLHRWNIVLAKTINTMQVQLLQALKI